MNSLRKHSRLTVLLLALFFILNSLFLYSEGIFGHFMHIRQHYIVGRSTATHTFVFKTNQWVGKQKIKEIKFQNRYFDIQTINYYSNKVVVKAVEDKYEHFYKFVLHQLKSSKKNPDQLPISKQKQFTALYNPIAQYHFYNPQIKVLHNFFYPYKSYFTILHPIFKPPIT